MLLFASLSTLPGCLGAGQPEISFTHPPTAGTRLQPQLRLVICDTPASAKYMAATGLFTADCRPLLGSDSYSVISSKRIALTQGEMWLIAAHGPQGDVWVPVPWHNWL